ncbi:DUF6455 family protein [Thalassovita taeanensis]|uniref:DUF6455 domain-containing protein n=1 Tax=Thalassovita taeanensis TaxID=657014 RepID=A0A1H9BC42_9RHOB|nr:DUF6455 family protein [Thalassovita taeanensis]SEP86307.1 hypothetical protein SAMN04488092_102447 [Thalassovita taeanensis]
MKPLGDMTRHYWLAQRMAKTTGTDLVAAQEVGALDQSAWAEMVQTCRSCDWTEGCERWLTTQAETADVVETCPNCNKFRDLQQTLAKDE